MNNNPIASADIRLSALAAAKLDPDEIAVLVSAFGKQASIPGLALDGNGTVEFEVDGIDVTLSMLAGFPGVLALAPLPEDIASDAEALFGLLGANLSWTETAGGTFTKVPGTEIIAYCRLISLAERDLDAFGRDLAGFVATARVFVEEVALEVDLADAIVPTTMPDSGAVHV